MARRSVLYISGSIGLGHVIRDLAIAGALRRQSPDVEISWLEAEPAGMILEQAGERLLPEAGFYENESVAAERAARGFRLDLLKYVLAAAPKSNRNLRVFKRVLKNNRFDLVIADEAYEVEIALQKGLVRMDAPHVVIHDFVGADSMTSNPFERVIFHLVNRTWAGGRRMKKRLAIFLGEPEDVPDRRFGLFLPNRRQWALRHYRFVGYALSFDPEDFRNRAQVRARLGYGPEPLVVCSVGGTAIGKDLLELCGRAFQVARERMADLRMVLVCGPRLCTESLHVPESVGVMGYVPNLYEHFAVADLAIVQGGLNTTLELAALRRPFIYFPLDGHFEQQLHVAGRLERLGAGVRMSYSATTPGLLAGQILSNLGKDVNYAPVPADGARKAAEFIGELL